ncbi:TIGR04211 family SH3 domain-containing protein [Sulfuriflexus mobilis]|uniref:TIGR04211 family SH3 domain-containing protein n=1 Tax=Sulfuriflexus mobilis TaxID=1811807 RepID=UPI000F82DD62|nr:TIGR04211 family SH3 domain-containing protein [Sulfuriflexus mobilis]
MKKIQWLAFMSAVLASALVQAQTYYVTDKILVGVYEEASAESILLTTLPTGTPLEVIDRSGNFVQIRSPDGSSGWIEKSYMIEHKPAQLVVLELTDKQKQADEQLTLAQAELRAMRDQVKKLKDSVNASNQSDLRDEIKNLTQQRRELGKQLDTVNNQLSDETKRRTAAEANIAALQQQIATLKKQAPAPDDDALQEADADHERLLAENQQLSTALERVREALQLPAAPAPGVVENGGLQVKMIWLWLGIGLLIVVGFIAGVKWLDWRNRQRHGGFRI